MRKSYEGNMNVHRTVSTMAHQRPESESRKLCAKFRESSSKFAGPGAVVRPWVGEWTFKMGDD